MSKKVAISVVIPSYKVKKHILSVIKSIGQEVSKIYVVDDKCPEETGKFVEKFCKDKRVNVIYHSINLGVGASVMTGYRESITDKMDIVVKIDGDGQMEPNLIPQFVIPIIKHEADYTKGNRFHDLDKLSSMPMLRLIGNALLSFLTKFSSGYWNIFDPTNGYTAIHIDIIKNLPLHKISNRFFFESDMLFRLNLLRALVIDIPMEAKYLNEKSNLRPTKVASEFLFKNLRNFLKRIFYNYYLRDLNVASFELPIGMALIFFGLFYGGYHWLLSAQTGINSPTGSIMISSLGILMGFQLILAFLNADISNVPLRCIHINYVNNFSHAMKKHFKL